MSRPVKPARAVVDRDPKPEIRVTVVRRVASPERRKRLVRLLAILMDKPDVTTGGQP